MAIKVGGAVCGREIVPLADANEDAGQTVDQVALRQPGAFQRLPTQL